MTNPTPPNAGRTYSDEEIAKILTTLDANRELIEGLGYSAGNLRHVTAIIRQLRADLRIAIEELAARKTSTVADYRKSRGALPWQPGDEPAEVSIRRLCDECAIGTDSSMFAVDETEYFGFARESEGQ